jgi:septation ring formation regulator EzrA
MMSESHAEIKDLCDDLETRLDVLAVDIRGLHFDYTIVDMYSHIDEEMFQIYEWYEHYKKMFKTYEKEKADIQEKLGTLEKKTKDLNNTVQSLKSQVFSRDTEARIHNYPIASVLEVFTECDILRAHIP